MKKLTGIASPHFRVGMEVVAKFVVMALLYMVSGGCMGLLISVKPLTALAAAGTGVLFVITGLVAILITFSLINLVSMLVGAITDGDVDYGRDKLGISEFYTEEGGSKPSSEGSEVEADG